MIEPTEGKFDFTLIDGLIRDARAHNLTPETPGPPIVGLAMVKEGRFAGGKWVRGRTLAGDDSGQGNNVSLDAAHNDGILRVTLYRYR